MRKMQIAAVLAIVSCLGGCATYQVGSADAAAQLKRFAPLPEKGSVYVFRESALLVARGVKTEVYVANENIRTVKQNNFVHNAAKTGKNGVLPRHDGIIPDARGLLSSYINAGTNQIIWEIRKNTC